MNVESLRVASLPLPARIMVTLFLLLVGSGYLVATANIYLQHQDADLEPGLTPADLQRTFHGLEKEVTPETPVTVTSQMLEQVRPGGKMRKFLEKGGEPAIQALVSWLEGGAKEEDFARAGLSRAGDPSAKEVIAARCVMCHHADGGDMEKLPYATNASSEPQYALVAKAAAPEYEQHESAPGKRYLAPTGVKELVMITHAHILAIPVFTLIVGGLFLMTGLGSTAKLILGPLPMLAIVLDIGSWWLARFAEPFIHVIAAAGAIFGASFGLQIICILASMWLGKSGQSQAVE